MTPNNNIYLFSNRIKNKKRFFQGYCFIGPDYIYGEEGAHKYREKNGTSIPAGEDGCYIYAEEKGGTYTFVNDYHGYKKIFYYHRGGVWVVSNSVVNIAEFLEEMGEEVNPNYAQLAAIGASNASAMQQLSSYNTFVDGVKLLPAGRKLVIDSSSCRIIKEDIGIAEKGYKESLELFLETWVSRAETLLSSDNMQVSCNLTGGVDSRACFAIFQAAKSRIRDSKAKLVYTCGSVGGDKTDLEVASHIADKCGERINGSSLSKADKVKGESSYDMWRYLCLGTYHPVYLPGRAIDPYIVKIMGGGGGNHRSVYSKYIKSKSIFKFASFCSKKIKPLWLSNQVYRDIVDFFEDTVDINNPNDLLIDHYIAFRNRFHAGRTPQNMVTFNPLGSKYADITALDKSVNNRDVAKVNYDIIFSLDSELLEMPFDRDYKSPGEEIKEKLVKTLLSKKSSPGEVYVVKSEKILRGTPVKEEKNKYVLFAHEARSALKNEFVNSFWGSEKIVEAKSVIDKLEATGKFSHAKEGQLLSAIIASSIFFK